MTARNVDTGYVAIVGCGVIGASWTAHYLARGYDVVATDPAPGVADRLHNLVETYWPALERIGLAEGASKDRLRFEVDLAQAVQGAAFVQENGPERLDIKRSLIAGIDAVVRDDVLIATSSSGILVSAIQDAARHPERVVLGHPLNPPHLSPLVEVGGGKLTSADSINRAVDFYRSIGKRPIRLRREMKGHVANRLQAALWQEAFYLVDEGVASVAEIDQAIAYGPGLRWALLGPFLNLQLSGGDRGIKHVLDHLGPSMEDIWNDQGRIAINPKIIEDVAEGVNEELKQFSLAPMIEQRDDVLLSLLALKNTHEQLP